MNKTHENLTPDQVEAILKKLGGEKGAKDFLRGYWVLSRPALSWTEDGEGTVRFHVETNGASGAEWAKTFGQSLPGIVRDVLLSEDFALSQEKTVYEIVVVRAQALCDVVRSQTNVCRFGLAKGWGPTGAEIACLCRSHISNPEMQEMGISEVVFTDPIRGGYLSMVARFESSRREMGFFNPSHLLTGEEINWGPDVGFAFVASSVKL